MRTERLTSGRWAVHGADTTWLRCLVKEIHDADPQSEAAVLQEHPLDSFVVLAAEPGSLRSAAAALLAEIGRLTVTDATARAAAVRVHGSPPWDYANLARRALMTRVPVLACTSLLVTRNDSWAREELLAHRFGQAVLTASAALAKDEQKTWTGSVDVEGRDARCSDLRLPPGVAVADDTDFVLVELRPGQRFCAELAFAFGTGRRHAKFDAVASPDYVPELRVDGCDEDAATLRAAGFVVDARSGRVAHPEFRVRKARLQELAPSLRCLAPSYVDVRFESLGQWPASECLELAKAAVAAEIDAFLESMAACEPDVASQPSSSGRLQSSFK